jgi:F0F1-type ATP synthase assembly protein I
MNPSDDRDPLAKATSLAYAAISICTEMVLPIAGGYWLDRHWGTQPVLTILGVVFGFVIGLWGLIKLVQPKSGRNP